MNSVKTNAILRIASIITFFLIWHLSSIFVDVELLPGTYEVSKKIIEEAESSELFFHTFITLKRVTISFIIAMFIGTFFGLYMGRNERANVVLDDVWNPLLIDCGLSWLLHDERAEKAKKGQAITLQP